MTSSRIKKLETNSRSGSSRIANASSALSPEPRAAVMSTPESTNVRILAVTGFQFVNSATTLSNLTGKLFVIEQWDTRFDDGGARRSQPATKFGSRLEFA